MNKPPADAPHSPCIRNCCLAPNNVCLGCWRTLDEILIWSQASDREKAEILQRCKERKKIQIKHFE